MPANPFYRPPVRGAKPPAPGSDKRSRLQILEEGIFELESVLARVVGNIAAHSGNASNAETRNLDRIKRLLAEHTGRKFNSPTASTNNP